jgi:hypothetical protein
VFLSIIKAINPTLACQVRDIRNIPIIYQKTDDVIKLVNEVIGISRTDWDSFETSWDFKRHPLVPKKENQ